MIGWLVSFCRQPISHVAYKYAFYVFGNNIVACHLMPLSLEIIDYSTYKPICDIQVKCIRRHAVCSNG